MATAVDNASCLVCYPGHNISFIRRHGRRPLEIRCHCVRFQPYRPDSSLDRHRLASGPGRATQRPPTMKDLSTLLGNEDDSMMDAIKGLFKNRLFRVIAVAAVANIGSILGTVIGVIVLAHYFSLNNPVGLLETGLGNGYHTITTFLFSLR